MCEPLPSMRKPFPPACEPLASMCEPFPSVFKRLTPGSKPLASMCETSTHGKTLCPPQPAARSPASQGSIFPDEGLAHVRGWVLSGVKFTAEARPSALRRCLSLRLEGRRGGELLAERGCLSLEMPPLF